MMRFIEFLRRGFNATEKDDPVPFYAAFTLILSGVVAVIIWYIWAVVVAITISVKISLLMVFAPPALFILITYLLWKDPGK